MRLAIVGGKLQGVEAAYLAGKAGYRSVLIDRQPACPAAGLADEVHAFDLLEDEARARSLLSGCDAVLPACEDALTLSWLTTRLPVWGIPLLFDPAAYEVTSSKIRSDQLFAELGIPHPRPWPCPFPVIVKPSGASGSEGVCLAQDQDQLDRAVQHLREQGEQVVVQEFVDGPSLSLEVLGWAGQQRALLPTALEFDAFYDCKRVTAPVEAPPSATARLAESGRLVAQGLALQGLTDLEVMLAGDLPKAIEIDARLPSQTPTVVLHASGLNVVELLLQAALSGRLPPQAADGGQLGPAVVYQHVRAAAGRLQVLGEHVMGGARPLRLVPDFFGAAEGLTDWEPGATHWVATLLTHGPGLDEARKGADEVVRRMAADLSLELLPESEPAPLTGCLASAP